jgi:signal transduction histidine kinase
MKRAHFSDQLHHVRRGVRALWPGTDGQPADPSAALFRNIRRRLILWYSGVLVGILLLSGLLLYGGMDRVLLGPIDGYLATNAQNLNQAWQDFEVAPCRSSPFAFHNGPFVACFDQNGNLLEANGLASGVPNFTSSALARAALKARSGAAIDTIDGGMGLGAIRRYALVVRNPDGVGVLGVVQVGIQIGGDIQALHVLLILLLLVGGLTVGVASAGGIFLAARALMPARLAFTRQQAFIADASHELRTPLTLLRTDAEVLLRGRDHLSPDDAMLLEDMVTEADRLSTLANNLLALARLDAGAYHPERDVIDLAEVGAGVARRLRTLANEQQVALAVEHAGQTLVIGDHTLLEQAAFILLDNAIKYNRAGGQVTLRTSASGQHARLEIQDTGIGIPAEHLPHLGERFYRVDKARSREAGGAGLGLAIAHDIAAMHHGTLTLSSTPNQGTTATLTLPAAGAAMP